MSVDGHWKFVTELIFLNDYGLIDSGDICQKFPEMSTLFDIMYGY